jgi:hypothetical protein
LEDCAGLADEVEGFLEHERAVVDAGFDEDGGAGCGFGDAGAEVVSGNGVGGEGERECKGEPQNPSSERPGYPQVDFRR